MTSLRTERNRLKNCKYRDKRVNSIYNSQYTHITVEALMTVPYVSLDSKTNISMILLSVNKYLRII